MCLLLHVVHAMNLLVLYKLNRISFRCSAANVHPAVVILMLDSVIHAVHAAIPAQSRATSAAEAEALT